jgi:transcriptional regulator with XRE-family HTH domain
MPPRLPSTLNPLAKDAAEKLGLLVAIGRRERSWSQVELAERVGTSHVTIGRIERGHPSVALGLYFQAAVLTGVPLFDTQPGGKVDTNTDRLRLALLPKRVNRRKVDNDF